MSSTSIPTLLSAKALPLHTRLLSRLLSALHSIFVPTQPLSILRKPPRPRYSPTSSLILIRVDFQMTKERAQVLDEQLNPLREKYGLDFLVQEPGVRFQRFDDI